MNTHLIPAENANPDEDATMADPVEPPKPNKKVKLLPYGVRCVVYSYLDLMTMVNSITKLSRTEREKVPFSDVIDQSRCLRIYIKEGKMI